MQRQATIEVQISNYDLKSWIIVKGKGNWKRISLKRKSENCIDREKGNKKNTEES